MPCSTILTKMIIVVLTIFCFSICTSDACVPERSQKEEKEPTLHYGYILLELRCLPSENKHLISMRGECLNGKCNIDVLFNPKSKTVIERWNHTIRCSCESFYEGPQCEFYNPALMGNSSFIIIVVIALVLVVVLVVIIAVVCRAKKCRTNNRGNPNPNDNNESLLQLTDSGGYTTRQKLHSGNNVPNGATSYLPANGTTTYEDNSTVQIRGKQTAHTILQDVGRNPLSHGAEASPSNDEEFRLSNTSN